MTTELHRRLVRYIRDEAGDAVRWVGRYEAESFTLLFSRDDVDQETFKSRVALTAELAQTKYTLVGDDRPEIETRAHIELFESVAVVHLRQGPETAVVFAVDVPPIGELTSFVERCRTLLEMPPDD